MVGFFKRRRKISVYALTDDAPLREAETGAAPRLARAKPSIARRRITLLGLAFGAGFLALTVRLAAITLFGAGPGGPPVFAESESAQPRREIVDRNGVLLAANLPVRALEVDGRQVWSADDTAAALARAFPRIDEERLAEKLRRKQYVEALNDLTPDDQTKAFALGLEGVSFRSSVRRFYPQESLASHVVGHIEAGRGGVMGLERALEDRPGPGREQGPLVAALDVRVQQVVEDELKKGMAEYHAPAAWGVVLDVGTGEVVALASLPDFDPNSPGAYSPDRRRNRAVYDRYELGSALKAMTAAAAIDAGTATVQSTYDARGSIRVADRVIHDFHPENRILTFFEVIEKSSNVGMVRMAEALGITRQKAALKALGLLDPLPIELAENRAPQEPDKWGPVESATISYGQGLAITPLHLAAAYAAVVNGGVYRVPTFLAAKTPRAGSQVFSEKTSAVMRDALRRVVTQGTGGAADVAGYFPIGKTATADKPGVGGYAHDRRISSFVGAFPGDHPRYVVLVSFDEPKPTAKSYGYATAGWNAAPVWGKIVARIAPQLGVMATKDPWSPSASLAAADAPLNAGVTR